MIILSATDGHIITDLPIGLGSDGATFNPATMEAFASAVTNGPLTAPANSTMPNGVYAGSQGFPQNSFNATNYWVDVLFAPGT